MSFFAELKRRNVIRMAGLYLVGAWLLVQVSSTILPMFSAPDWLPRTIVLALAIGFVPALIFSWVFELTPDGLKRDAEVKPEESIAPQTARRMDRILLVVSILAIGYFAFDKFVLAPRREATLVAQTTQQLTDKANEEKSTINPHSIAVLPFVNMSDDKENEYFSDGIAEELLNQLAQFADLKVAARTSAFQFKGRNLDVADIGHQLHVSHVLEGSVRREGGQMRITAQLIDTTSGFHLWSQTFDRSTKDVFKVQDEISAAIAHALEAKISGRGNAAATAQPANPAAYDAYLQGRAFLARRLGDNVILAIKAFDRAIALDSTFSSAWSARGFAYTIEPGWSATIPLGEAFPKALADADAALRLDPDNAEAYMVRGNVHSVRWEVAAARADYDRALRLAPGSVDILNFAGDDYEFSGNLRAAEHLKRQAMALDPLAFVHPANLAQILSAQGRFPEALDTARRSVDLGGGYFARLELVVAQARLGLAADAAETRKAICDEKGADDINCLLSRIYAGKAAGDSHEVADAALPIVRDIAALKSSDSQQTAGILATEVGDIKNATVLLRHNDAGVGYGPNMALIRGPHGAQLPEEVSTDPDWLAVWSDPRLSEGMAVYRANLAAFRKRQ